MAIHLFHEFENIRNTPNLEDRYDTLELYQAIIGKNELPQITKEKALHMVQTVLDDLGEDTEPIDYIIDHDTMTSFQVDSIYFSIVRDIAKVYPTEVLSMIEACPYSQRQWDLYNGLLYALKQTHHTEQVRTTVLPILIENTIQRQSKGNIPSAIEQRYVNHDQLPAYMEQYKQRILQPPDTWPKAWQHQFDAIRYVHQTYTIPSVYMDPLLELCRDARTFRTCLLNLMYASKDQFAALEFSNNA